MRLPSPGRCRAAAGGWRRSSVEVDGATVRGWLCLPPEGGAPGAADAVDPRRPVHVLQLLELAVEPVDRGRPRLGGAAARPGRCRPATARAGSSGRGRTGRASSGRTSRPCSTRSSRGRHRRQPDRLLGASFGGFMTNWIAGHTDRFGAIVTHAGLWALDQQHATTDAAHYKTGSSARWPSTRTGTRRTRRTNRRRDLDADAGGPRQSGLPGAGQRGAARSGGTWSAASDGDPGELPHRFLQFTGENHWVLSPANARDLVGRGAGLLRPARARRAVDADAAALTGCRSGDAASPASTVSSEGPAAVRGLWNTSLSVPAGWR